MSGPLRLKQAAIDAGINGIDSAHMPDTNDRTTWYFTFDGTQTPADETAAANLILTVDLDTETLQNFQANQEINDLDALRAVVFGIHDELVALELRRGGSPGDTIPRNALVQNIRNYYRDLRAASNGA